MLSIEEQLGIDTSDPEIKRAEFLADQIAELLQHLVAVRKRRGLTQADLAKKLNVTQATIAAFERSSNDPKLSTVRKYANAVGALVALNVELDDGQLFDGRADRWNRTNLRSLHMSYEPFVSGLRHSSRTTVPAEDIQSSFALAG
jgi:transcriptional regulator with XRE-family HTH domain